MIRPERTFTPDSPKVSQRKLGSTSDGTTLQDLPEGVDTMKHSSDTGALMGRTATTTSSTERSDRISSRPDEGACE